MTFRDANPYYGTSYSVNSEKLGPYGDAITQELVPYLESQFRMIPDSWARIVAGGSTGEFLTEKAQPEIDVEFQFGRRKPHSAPGTAFQSSNMAPGKICYLRRGSVESSGCGKCIVGPPHIAATRKSRDEQTTFMTPVGRSFETDLQNCGRPGRLRVPRPGCIRRKGVPID